MKLYQPFPMIICIINHKNLIKLQNFKNYFYKYNKQLKGESFNWIEL